MDTSDLKLMGREFAKVFAGSMWESLLPRARNYFYLASRSLKVNTWEEQNPKKIFQRSWTSGGCLLFKEQSVEQLKIGKTIWQRSRPNEVQRKCCWQKFISFHFIWLIKFSIGENNDLLCSGPDFGHRNSFAWLVGALQRWPGRESQAAFCAHSLWFHWIHFPLFSPN